MMPLVGFLIYCAIVVPPFWILLPRFGVPQLVALVAIIPLGAVTLLWVMALRSDRSG